MFFFSLPHLVFCKFQIYISNIQALQKIHDDELMKAFEILAYSCICVPCSFKNVTLIEMSAMMMDCDQLLSIRFMELLQI